MSAMDRRRFLWLFGAGATAGMAASARVAVAADDLDELDELARPALLATLGADAVRAIGAGYRQAAPAERDPAALRAAILSSRGSHARLADLVTADFALGRTVVVRGWVLSVTEARQCALLSLLPV